MQLLRTFLNLRIIVTTPLVFMSLLDTVDALTAEAGITAAQNQNKRDYALGIITTDELKPLTGNNLQG